MSHCANSPLRVVLGPTLVAASALYLAGCDTTIRGNNSGGAATAASSTGSTPGNKGGGGGDGGTSGATGGSGNTGNGGSAGTSVACDGNSVTTPKRVVRLVERQLVNSYESLFGRDALTSIAKDLVLEPLISRPFPPINGEVRISSTEFATAKTLAEGAMAYVAQNPTLVAPNCGATPTDASCVQQALLAFAEKAWRAPLTEENKAEITGPFWTGMTDAVTGAGGSVAQALQYGVYGILIAPEFLYRTEFGADPLADGPIAPYELASQLSYFITNGPPDTELLGAAEAGALSDPTQVRAHARRLLGKPEARANIETAILGRFDIGKVRSAVVTESLAPWLPGGLTEGLKESIFHEGELFVRNTLWAGPLDHLLTSRRTWIRAEMAPIYGVPAPAEVDVDENGFGPVDLGPERAGILTLSAFLTSRSRPAFGASAVARGLAVNDAIICRVNPLFPTVVDPDTGLTIQDPAVTAAIEMLAGKPEKERYEYRINTEPCGGCHAGFDGFGMVLEGFDVLGRARTADLEGRTIDQAWTTAPLPASVWYEDTTGDGWPDPVTVTNAVEMAEAVLASGAFTRCVALNFIDFALADVSQGGARSEQEDPTTSCAIRAVVDSFMTTDRTFESLVAEIAASSTLLQRTRGM